MKRFQLILLCVICIVKSYGQTIPKSGGKIVVEITKEKKSKKDSIKFKIISFSGIDSIWVAYLQKNFEQSIDIDKRAKKGKYIVTVNFIMSKDGYLSDIFCEKNPGFGLCEQVVRVMKKGPKWNPS